MAQFKSIPITIEAIQYNGSNEADIIAAFGAQNVTACENFLLVKTPTGEQSCRINDWVVNQDDYLEVVEADIFPQMYEPA